MADADTAELDHPVDVVLKHVPRRLLALPQTAEQLSRHHILGRKCLLLASELVDVLHLFSLRHQCGMVRRQPIGLPAPLDRTVAAINQ
jgi:hypothetical protein